MMRPHLRAKASLGLTALMAVAIGLVWTVAAQAGTTEKSGPPPAPPWVGPDNRVDMSKLPDDHFVVGPDGKTVKDRSGKEVKFKVEKVPPAPAAPSAPGSGAIDDGTSVGGESAEAKRPY